MKQRLTRYKPKDIIFEILEHDVKPGANIDHLKKLKAEGYRFALDDFDFGPSHQNRLTVFGDLVDFIKIDGKLVRDCLDGKKGMSLQKLRDLKDKIKTQCPHVQLIAEHVDNFDEAKMLFAMGFDDVQGMYLRQEAYEAKILNVPQKDDVALRL